MTGGIRNIYHTRAASINLFIVLLSLLMLYQYRYGLGMLNPVNDAWLMKHDWATHYLGWFFYRNEPWGFPIGKISNYLYPVSTNVGFTDSIPLASIFFKIFSPILPHNFQFIGAWMLMCHVLLAYFVIKLLDLFSIKGLVQLVGTLIVVFNPVLLHRSIHPALCSHWLIVGSIWIYFLDPKTYSPTRLMTYQGIFLVVGGLINPYFSLIEGGFSLALAWRLWRFDRTVSLRKAFIVTAATSFLLLVCWYAVGFFAFRSKMDLGVSGAYGMYAFNLNSLYNSGGWSAFFPGLPLVSWHQYESFMYLGIGMMGLFLLTALMLAIKLIQSKIRGVPEQYWFGKSETPLLPLLLFVIGISLFALTNVITFNDKVLWTISLPDEFLKVADMFRASARYFWVAYYLLFIFIVVQTIRIVKRIGFALILLTVVFAAQLYDYQTLLGRYVGDYNPYHPPLTEVEWRKIFEKMDRFIFYPPFESQYLSPGDYMYFSYLAADYKKKINLGYAARLDNKAIRDYTESLKRSIDQDSVDRKTVYIATPEYASRISEGYYSNLLAYGQLDGYYVFYPRELHQDQAFSGVNDDHDQIINRRKIFKPFTLLKRDVEVDLTMQIQRLEKSAKNFFLKGYILKNSSMNIAELSVLLKADDGKMFISSPIKVAPDSIRVSGPDSLKFNTTYFTGDVPSGDYRIAAYASSGEGMNHTGNYSFLGSISIGHLDTSPPKELPEFPRLRYWFDEFEDTDEQLKIVGWAFIDGVSSFDNRIEILIRTEAKTYTSPADPMVRGDVTSFFNSPKNLETSGFGSIISKKTLKEGEYEVGIRIIDQRLHREVIEFSGRRFYVEAPVDPKP